MRKTHRYNHILLFYHIFLSYFSVIFFSFFQGKRHQKNAFRGFKKRFSKKEPPALPEVQ